MFSDNLIFKNLLNKYLFDYFNQEQNVDSWHEVAMLTNVESSLKCIFNESQAQYIMKNYRQYRNSVASSDNFYSFSHWTLKSNNQALINLISKIEKLIIELG